jgi:hypothetical protein
MSYQKHHAPSSQIIQEDQQYEEDLKVIRPLQGIESNKHQPIVRANRDAKFTISPIEECPIDYIKQYHGMNERILNMIKPKEPVKIKSFAKSIQTTPIQSSTQYNASSANGNKYFSMKTTKKSPLIGVLNAAAKNR